MIIILTCIAILVVGIVMRKIGNKIAAVDFSLASEGIGVILIFFGIVGLVTIAISLPLIHSSIKAEMRQFEKTKATYEWAREQDVDLEIAAIQLNIAEYNRWLKNKQYWNNTIIGLFIPDQVMELKPIQ